MQEDLPKAKIKRVSLPRRQAERSREGGRERFVKYHHFCIYECYYAIGTMLGSKLYKYFLPFSLARHEVLSALCHELQLSSMECGG